MSDTSKPHESDLWKRLTELPRPFRLFDFPRNGPDGQPLGQVAIWVLTQAEHHAATAAADAAAKKSLKDPQAKADENIGYDTIFNNEASVQILAIACRDPKNLAMPLFPTASVMRMKLTTTEIGVLMSMYIQHQAESGPLITHMRRGEMDAWLQRIADSGENEAPFYLLSPAMKNDLLRFSASRLSSSSTDTSSAGSLPDEPLPSDES